MGTYKGFTLKSGVGKGKKEIKQAKHRELIFDWWGGVIEDPGNTLETIAMYNNGEGVNMVRYLYARCEV